MEKKQKKKSHFSIKKLEDTLTRLTYDFAKEYPGGKKFTNTEIDGIEDEGFFVILLRRDATLPTGVKAYCKTSFGRQMTVQDIVIGLDGFIEGLFKADDSKPMGEA